MKQQTLAMAADQSERFERYRRPTRRDEFLATMDHIVPWAELCAVIEPHYPKAGNGRPPVGLARMLRMYFVQHWFNLADEACEEALLDSVALRRFVGIDLGRERVPDGTTLLKFRRLLEKHKLGTALFAKVGEVLQGKGMKVGTGTIVDATIISAPPSTKNAQGERDPEMHQTRKGQQWYFGMKLHIGVDSKTGLAHSAVVTAANVHDKHPLPQLLHGAEVRQTSWRWPWFLAACMHQPGLHLVAPGGAAQRQAGVYARHRHHRQHADQDQHGDHLDCGEAALAAAQGVRTVHGHAPSCGSRG